jgi:hypothetical protein
MTIKKIPSGQKNYFQMDTLEKKNHFSAGYPKGSLAIEIYDAIAECCPRCSRAIDLENLPFDSSSISPTNDK